jgi:hypothetical protein
MLYIYIYIYIYIKHWKEDERCFNLNDILDYFYNSDVFSLFIIATLRDDMEFEYFITFCLCKDFILSFTTLHACINVVYIYR